MELCWSGEPSKRPLLGAIQPVLELIQQKIGKLKQVDALNTQETSSSQINPVLALKESNNQRGAAYNLALKRKPFKITKPVPFHSQFYKISVFPNAYIAMQEF